MQVESRDLALIRLLHITDSHISLSNEARAGIQEFEKLRVTLWVRRGLVSGDFVKSFAAETYEDRHG